MRVNAIAIAAVFGAISLVASVACSSKSSGDTAVTSFDCSTYGSNKCANDPAPTSAESAECTTALADANCGSTAAAVLACENGPHTCDANGMTDQAALQTTCTTQYSAYATCLMLHPNDGGDTPSGIIASGHGNADEGQPPLAQCPAIGAADAGDVDFGSAACDQCMADACCSSTTTCAASATCAASVTCLLACGDDTSCQNNCATSAADTDALNAVLNCLDLGCTTDAGVGPCD